VEVRLVGHGGIGVAAQLVEIGALLIPDNQIAAPVKGLDVARHDVLKKVRTHNEDQKHGVEMVRKALSWPARQIALNAGEDGSVVIGKILEKDTYGFGFDAQSGEYVNLMSKGIIDPTKVPGTSRHRTRAA
jgi:chaperonin GroEL (HSP60 family)